MIDVLSKIAVMLPRIPARIKSKYALLVKRILKG